MAEDDAISTLLTRKTIYCVVRLDLERVALPGGHVHELEVVHHPGASCVVPFVSEDDILLLRQFRHAGGGYLLELPAGTLHAGEDPDDCARRELEEETGCRAARFERLGRIRTTPGFSDELIHLYEAHDLEAGTQATEACEVLTVERVAFAEALEMVADGRLTDAKSICALSLAHLRRR
jgi:ADP-ribose pyrophosphatase